MKEIFKHIEGREWDWFGNKENAKRLLKETDFDFVYDHYFGISDYDQIPIASLADLLANKSFCIAVWGAKPQATKAGWWTDSYKDQSKYVFQILQQEGEEKAIEYIKKTMI